MHGPSKNLSISWIPWTSQKSLANSFFFKMVIKANEKAGLEISILCMVYDLSQTTKSFASLWHLSNFWASMQRAKMWLAMSLHFWSSDPILMKESRIWIIFNWSLNPFIISTKLFILILESSRIPSRWTRQMYWRCGLLLTLEIISMSPLMTSEAKDLLAVVESSKMNLY